MHLSRHAVAALAVLALFSAEPVQAQVNPGGADNFVVSACGSGVTYQPGQYKFSTVDTNGNFCTNSSGGGGGTVSQGPGNVADPWAIGGAYNGSLFILPLDSSHYPFIDTSPLMWSSAGGTPGSFVWGTTGIFYNSPTQVSDGQSVKSFLPNSYGAMQVDLSYYQNALNSASNAPFVKQSVSSDATTAVAFVSTSSASSSLQLKSSAGNLFSAHGTCTAATFYVFIFDRTSVPSNGAITLASDEIVDGPFAANQGWNEGGPPPASYSNGILVVGSSTGPYTLTASSTCQFQGQVK